MLQQLTFDLNTTATRRRIAESGSAQEILGMLLEDNTEKAAQILDRFGGGPGLRSASIEDLVAEGISLETATRLLGALRLSVAEKPPNTVHAPEDAYKICSEMQLLAREELWVLNLDVRNNLKSVTHMYTGTVCASNVRVAEVFRPAIVQYASKVVVVHNHPSGDPTPSPEDVTVTRELMKAGQILDIEVLDHVVIGQGRWASLKALGVL